MNWVLKILMWLLGFWKTLPAHQKKLIIQTIIKTFINIFRNIYSYYKNKKNKHNLNKEEKVNIDDFFSDESSDKNVPQNASIQTTSLQTSTATLSLDIHNILGTKGNQEKKFSDDISKTIHSKQFMDELSKKIDIPKENESEEEFIERAGEAMKSLLYEKFNLS
ncbi:hypothetical protein [Candidatus Uabimicrobium amorphum]|uniref:Uncharacterized protein n=1 Tax=Uabimicrobium amorphum TaxID=2596890 RepID=A0A5S9ILQ2_UABAM|nr:hypothetical protein [Candidatus Uabimicrobium amorphum]BBM83360.1 hypothetical protein UABAM_01712 [Candidatus Uabimicrobium amorphum]